jgi:hypothetical protein
MSVLNYGVEAKAQPSDFPSELIANQSIAGILGFCNLFCTNMNDIVVELLISVKLFVKQIDYKALSIHVYFL